mmetsp:Transcript_54620/g.116039  ORF Transcript_54620/g.116039 Transcript_54620/m.116039 type:complete len:307 (-) Transcript_54620:170-1090(-)
MKMSSGNIFIEGIAEDCVRPNGLGQAFFELSCVYPSLGKLYLPFEKFYDPAETLGWMQLRPTFPIWSCILYLILITVGRSHMEKNPAWSWRRVLAAWNLSLSLFSTIGFLRTAPHLFHNLMSYPLREVMCGDPKETYGSGSTGLWVQLFILSKFPELLDTFFIVVHKKPLIFLHWYHHVTVLLFCWHSYVTASPPGLFFVTMNYAVHAVMYGYYFLMAVGMRPRWFNPIVVTLMQIAQMAVGVSVTALGFYFYSNPEEGRICNIQKENLTAGFIMYGSYFYLFLHFFLTRYIKIKVEQGSMAKKKA